MRQLGERRNRIFAFRALSQFEGVVLKRYAGVRLVVRAIERVMGLLVRGSAIIEATVTGQSCWPMLSLASL